MKRLACLFLALVLPASAFAQTLALPDHTLEIGKEAFRGDKSIVEAKIPFGTTSIGDLAFADCTGLQEIAIPASVTSIGTDVFDGCRDSLLIRTTAQSPAMNYAASHLIDYQADTTYRALIIGQSDYEAPVSVLKGPANDVVAMNAALSRHSATPYQCTVKTNLKAMEIVSAVSTVFKDAKAQDVSLIYYSGHGVEGGKLVGVDRVPITPSLLRQVFDKIPGRKIVIVDACHSGAIIDRDGNAAAPEQEFVEAFTTAFSFRTRDHLATDGYYVITAAHSSQKSLELAIGDSGYFGLFTRYFCDGLGYDYLKKQNEDVLSDTNADGVVSIHEAYTYAKDKAYAFAAKYDRTQVAQVFPENCTYQSVVRK